MPREKEPAGKKLAEACSWPELQTGSRRRAGDSWSKEEPGCSPARPRRRAVLLRNARSISLPELLPWPRGRLWDSGM